MSERPYLSIILPMYNEAESITAVLPHLVAEMAHHLPQVTYEILVVDDGSSDGSAERVTAVADDHITLIQHPYNIGNGAAVKSSIRRAKGRYVLMMDADGQHKPADIPRLLEYVPRHDMVVGARTRESESARHRDLANMIYNLFASYVCERPIDDLTSGFRLIRAELAKSLVYLLPNTFSYPTTVTLAVVRGGYSLKYVPIVARKRVGKSKIKLFRDGSRFLMIILKTQCLHFLLPFPRMRESILVEVMDTRLRGYDISSGKNKICKDSVKIATLYSPMKVFLPVSVLLFATGFFYGLFKVLFLNTRYGPTSAMLMTISIVVFMVGLVSEQVAQLRYIRSDTADKEPEL